MTDCFALDGERCTREGLVMSGGACRNCKPWPYGWRETKEEHKARIAASGELVRQYAEENGLLGVAIPARDRDTVTICAGRIRGLIKDAGLTQYAFCERNDIARTTLGNALTLKKCSRATAKKIAAGLGVEVSEIVEVQT